MVIARVAGERFLDAVPHQELRVIGMGVNLMIISVKQIETVKFGCARRTGNMALAGGPISHSLR